MEVLVKEKQKKIRYLVTTFFLISIIFILYVYSNSLPMSVLEVDFTQQNLRPSLAHYFGTDWLGRDMFLRVAKGLSISLTIGFWGAVLSTGIAIILSGIAMNHQIFDQIVTYLMDLITSIPHLLLLIILSFVVGGDVRGVIFALALTHWPSTTRLLRNEIHQIKSLEYVQVSLNLGKKYSWIVWHHYLPLLLPQIFLSVVLTFPHVLLHESAMTFLGFGLGSNDPAIGNILSEAMTHLLNGSWWLAFYPGLCLVLSVIVLEKIGQRLSKILMVNLKGGL